MEHVLNLGLNINVNVPLDGKERTVRKLITVPKLHVKTMERVRVEILLFIVDAQVIGLENDVKYTTIAIAAHVEITGYAKML